MASIDLLIICTSPALFDALSKKACESSGVIPALSSSNLEILCVAAITESLSLNISLCPLIFSASASLACLALFASPTGVPLSFSSDSKSKRRLDLDMLLSCTTFLVDCS